MIKVRGERMIEGGNRAMMMGSSGDKRIIGEEEETFREELVEEEEVEARVNIGIMTMEISEM